MTTRPRETTETTERRSRLDPEQMPRRDFLGLAAMWAAASAGLFAVAGMLRLPRAAVLPAPSKKFRVEIPDSLPPGQPFFPADRAVALFRDEKGVYALSAICTHLGCIVKQKAHGFSCPCHGSEFGADGEVLKGPAPAPLPWLAVEKDGEGFVVDAGTTVAPDTRVVT